MGQVQGQSAGQVQGQTGVKRADKAPGKGSRRSNARPVDPGREGPLRLSPPACFPAPMQKAPASGAQDPAVAEHNGMALSHLVAALQHLQALVPEARGTEQKLLLEGERRIKGLLALLARREEPREVRSPMDPEQFRQFAEVVRQRRQLAGLNQEQLAKAAGLSLTTIKGIEAARQNPCRATLCRLLAVSELGLEVGSVSRDVQADPGWAPNSMMAGRYNAARLFEEMVDLVNSPGGSFEQTYLYVDGQSANDWYGLSNHAPFVQAFRSSAPLEELARRIARESGRRGIDVEGLGSGDGKSEVRVAKGLVEALGKRADVKLHLLDISHTLLSAAYNYAKEALEPAGVEVLTVHADFHDLPRLPILHGSSAPLRRRVYAMLGGTVANLENEIRFFRDLAGCALPGDFLLVDGQTVVAPANRPDLVRATDPPLVHGPSPTHLNWLTGPLRRHCRDLVDVKLSMELTTACPVPGSYELDCVAEVTLRSGERRRFLVWRGKRYDPVQLAECLRSLGWELVQSVGYGPGKEKAAALLLLRRMER